MTRYRGNGLRLQWTPDGGSTYALNTEYRTFNVSEGIDKVDVTTAAQTAKKYKATIRDTTLSLDMLDRNDATGTSRWAALDRGTMGTLIWNDQSGSNDAPTACVYAFVSSRKLAFKPRDVVIVSVEWQSLEAITEDIRIWLGSSSVAATSTTDILVSKGPLV